MPRPKKNDDLGGLAQKILTDAAKEIVETKTTRAQSPADLLKVSMHLIAQQIVLLQTKSDERILPPHEAAALKGYVEILIRANKEYRDGDIDNGDEYSQLTEEQQNALLLETCRKRGLIDEHGQVVIASQG